MVGLLVVCDTHPKDRLQMEGPWDVCEPLVTNYKGAKFKGFFSIAEAELCLEKGDFRGQSGSVGRRGQSMYQSGSGGLRGHNIYKTESSGPRRICGLEFDGSSRGIPRIGGAGCILYNEDNDIVYEIRVGLGEVSNNAAEYLALVHGMRTALHLGMRRLQARGDSSLIVSQVGGVVAVGPELSVFHREVTLLSSYFEVFEICEVDRLENERADRAAADALLYPVCNFISEFP